MSYLGELDSAGWEQRVAEKKANYSPPPEEKPGFFEGSIKAPAMGLLKGGANAADLLVTAFGKSPAMSEEQERINELADKMQEEQVESAKEFWTPDPRTIGTAGRVLGGFSEMVLPLAAGAGEPALLIGATALNEGKNQVDAGVDAQTAGMNAAFAGAGTYAGFKMPIFGGTLGQRMASGAIGNTVVNAGVTAAEHATLKARGYEELAQNYDPTDLEARAVDLITGLAFGATHHLASPSQRSAAAAANNAKHYQADTAPGIPENAVADAAHLRAMDTATEQLVTGEPVSVPEDVTQAAFRERPERTPPPIPEELRAFDEARAASVKSEPPPDAGGYDVAEGVLTDEQLAQFQGLRSHVQADQNADGAGGRAPASEGSGDAGGSGTEAGQPLEVFRGADRPLTAEHFGEEALGRASGNPSSGLGVFFTNDHADASRYGPLVERAHLDIRNPKIIKIEDFPAFDTLEEAAAFRKKLQAEGHDGIVIDISHLGGPTQYVAFDHAQVVKPVAKPARAAKSAPKPAAKAEAMPKTEAAPATKAEQPAEHPQVTAMREHLAGADVKVPTGGFDAEGNPEMRSAREVLAEADAEVAHAESMGQGIAAAVSCFLSRGV